MSDIYDISEFDKLSRELTDQERKSILSKINVVKDGMAKSDDIEDAKTEVKSEVVEYATKIYNNSSFLYKVVIFFTALFSGKKKYDAVIDHELGNLKKDLCINYGSYIDITERKLTGEFIKEFQQLARLCDKTSNIIYKYFEDPLYFAEFLSKVAEESFSEKMQSSLDTIYPDKINNKTDFVNKQEYMAEKDRRLKKFFAHLDVIIFDNINTQFNLFEILQKLIQFDFKSLFQNFMINDFSENVKSSYTCRFEDTKMLLQRLYKIICSINFVLEDINFVYKIVDFVKSHPVGTDTTTIFCEETVEDLNQIVELSKSIREKVPLKQIFMYFTRNLLYKAQPINMNYDFISIYKEYKKTIAEKVWDKYFTILREDNLNTMMKKMFGSDYKFNTLSYFTPSLKKEIDDELFVRIGNIHKLNILLEFLISVYKIKIEVAVNKILVEGIFRRDGLRSNVSVAYYLLNGYEAKVRDFDADFNPEKEVGKKISLSIKRIKVDPSYKTPFTNFISDLNAESDKYVAEMTDAFKTMKTFLVSLVDVENISDSPLMNFDKIKIPGYPNTFIAAEKAASLFEQFETIYKIISDIL